MIYIVAKFFHPLNPKSEYHENIKSKRELEPFSKIPSIPLISVSLGAMKPFVPISHSLLRNLCKELEEVTGGGQRTLYQERISTGCLNSRLSKIITHVKDLTSSLTNRKKWTPNDSECESTRISNRIPSSELSGGYNFNVLSVNVSKISRAIQGCSSPVDFVVWSFRVVARCMDRGWHRKNIRRSNWFQFVAKGHIHGFQFHQNLSWRFGVVPEFLRIPDFLHGAKICIIIFLELMV